MACVVDRVADHVVPLVRFGWWVTDGCAGG